MRPAKSFFVDMEKTTNFLFFLYFIQHARTGRLIGLFVLFFFLFFFLSFLLFTYFFSFVSFFSLIAKSSFNSPVISVSRKVQFLMPSYASSSDIEFISAGHSFGCSLQRFLCCSIQLKLPAYLMRHIIRQRSEPNACQRSSDAIFIHLFRFQLRQAVVLNQEEIFSLFHPKLFRHLLRLQQVISVLCRAYCFCKNPANPIIVSFSVHLHIFAIFNSFYFIFITFRRSKRRCQKRHGRMGYLR